VATREDSCNRVYRTILKLKRDAAETLPGRSLLESEARHGRAEHGLRRRTAAAGRGIGWVRGKGNSIMKTSIIGLLFAAAFLAIIPISPQVTPRGIELKVDVAQAYYGHARRVTRRVARRTYRRGYYGGAYYGAAPRYGCRCY